MFKEFSAFILAEKSTITGSFRESKTSFVLLFETRPHFVAQAALRIVAILLPQFPELGFLVCTTTPCMEKTDLPDNQFPVNVH